MDDLWTVKKKFKFEAAHRLIDGYPGKCKNIHGHSWEVQIMHASSALDKFGMAKDFGDFKDIKEWCMDFLDHATIVHKKDFKLKKFLKDNHQKLWVVDGNPTSEVIAKLIYEKAEKMGLEPCEVTINETCTSECTYTRFDDHEAE